MADKATGGEVEVVEARIEGDGGERESVIVEVVGGRRG